MVNTPDVVSEMYQDVLKGHNVVSFTKEENDKIKSTDKVVFGVYKDRLPLSGVDANGNCVGIYVDILKEIAAQSKLNIEIKPIEDSNRLYNYMDDGSVEFVIGIKDLRYSSENADNYLMSNSITDYTTVAVTGPEYQFDNDDTPVFALTKDRNYLENYIQSNFPSATITYFDNRKQCLNAIKRGKADATFMNSWEYNYESKNARFQNMIEWESLRIPSGIALGATRQSDMELLSIFEKAVSQISPDRIADMIAANLNMPYQTYNLADRLYEKQDGIFMTVVLGIILFICLAIYTRIRKRYINDLVIANKTKSDFLSRMSHELRTPLNAINGYATLTQQNVETGKIEKERLIENMSAIYKASEYLLGIIKDILDVQRMETGKITLEISEINPNEYMHNVVNMIQPMADEKKVDFTYTMINGGEANYLLDGIRVQQILFNILYNAVKFTPEGGHVTMTSEASIIDDTYATLQFIISDTGIGMSQEFLDTKLFQKFAQENQDMTKKLLQRMNCEVVIAENGKIGLDTFANSEAGYFSMILMDIRMPEMDGLEATRRIRALNREDAKDVPIVAISANAFEEDIRLSLEAGMNEHLAKPVDARILYEKIKQYCQ